MGAYYTLKQATNNLIVHLNMGRRDKRSRDSRSRYDERRNSRSRYDERRDKILACMSTIYAAQEMRHCIRLRIIELFNIAYQLERAFNPFYGSFLSGKCSGTITNNKLSSLQEAAQLCLACASFVEDLCSSHHVPMIVPREDRIADGVGKYVKHMGELRSALREYADAEAEREANEVVLGNINAAPSAAVPPAAGNHGINNAAGNGAAAGNDDDNVSALLGSHMAASGPGA